MTLTAPDRGDVERAAEAYRPGTTSTSLDF